MVRTYGIELVFVVHCAMDTSKVRGLIRDDLNLDRLRSHAVATNNLNSLVQRASRRLIIVKQVSGNQDHVTLEERYVREERSKYTKTEACSTHLVLAGEVEALFKGSKAVEAPNGISLAVAQVIVCAHKHSQDVIVYFTFGRAGRDLFFFGGHAAVLNPRLERCLVVVSVVSVCAAVC